jgi:3D (Asp-Asp-Asp) domain-containing protein
MNRLLAVMLLMCVSCQPVGGQNDISLTKKPSASRKVVSEQKPFRIAELAYKDDGSSVIQLVPQKREPVIIPKPIKVSTERTILAKVTAYCPCERCCRRMTGITSTQTNAWQPGIAVAPAVIPYGSVIYVPGYDRSTWVVADDTGSAMRRSWRNDNEVHVDVRMTYHWQAREWGTQYLNIIVRTP